MKQKVHNVPYLAVVLLWLKGTTSSDCIAFPQGAEILDVSLEVMEPADADLICDLGLKGSTDFFANDIDLSLKGHHNSGVKHTAKDKGVITLTLNKEATRGVVKVRAMYFAPSTILAEY